jgi:hypothetical protein
LFVNESIALNTLFVFDDDFNPPGQSKEDLLSMGIEQRHFPLREQEREIARIDWDVSFDWQILPDGERSISVTQSIDMACWICPKLV